ncbi:MAG: helix-turn-helix transcriptional regulator [Acidimicrobiia bacterium]
MVASSDDGPDRAGIPRLDLFKALGDDTRYAIYLELADSDVPLATAELAESLGLHVNTVRPHLERMRELRLLDVHVDSRGAVGRPQHRYALAADAPALGFEPKVLSVLANMLVDVALRAGAGSEDAADAGRNQGQAEARPYVDAGAPCLDTLVHLLDRYGFDPVLEVEDDTARIDFALCPFRELAEAHPGLVCHLHRGLVEGIIAAAGEPGASVTAFHTLADRSPCMVTISGGAPGGEG